MTPSELNEAVERLRKLSDIADKNATPFVPCGPSDLAALIAFYDSATKALKPFANEADHWDVSPLPEEYLMELACDATCADCGSGNLKDVHEATFSLLDLRRARAALSALPLPEGE